MESPSPGQPQQERGNFRTEVLYGAANAVGRGVEFMANSKKRMDLYYDSRAPSIVIEVAEYRDGYRAVKQRGGKIRVITDITKENIQYCKKLMEMAELRHLAEVKGGLAVNETEYMATTILEEAKPLTQGSAKGRVLLFRGTCKGLFRSTDRFLPQTSFRTRRSQSIQKLRILKFVGLT